MGNDTRIESMDTSKTQTSLGAGYHQCKVARRRRVCKDVFDIFVERVSIRFSVKPDHLSSFDQQFDNAIENCFIGTRNTLTCMQNISCTFNPRDLSCVVYPDSHSALVSREGGKTPITLVLSNQTFPPIIEGGEGENYVRILRVEDGSLGEIVDLALEMFLKGIPGNSVVLLGSGTHLLRVGSSGYCHAWVESSGKLAKLCHSVQVCPLPPILS